jgi:hypothetical protein
MKIKILKKNIVFIFFSIYLTYGTALAEDPVRLQIVQTTSTYPPEIQLADYSVNLLQTASIAKPQTYRVQIQHLLPIFLG